MNRREFLTTSIVVATACGVPISLAATEFKYPLIGQPFIGALYTTNTWDRYGYYFVKTYSKRLYDFRIESKFVEVIFKKSRVNHFNKMIPLQMLYSAYIVIDLETYNILKCRSMEPGMGYIDPPLGSNIELVRKNRCV